jgi:hypothetical protein
MSGIVGRTAMLFALDAGSSAIGGNVHKDGIALPMADDFPQRKEWKCGDNAGDRPDIPDGAALGASSMARCRIRWTKMTMRGSSVQDLRAGGFAVDDRRMLHVAMRIIRLSPGLSA